MPRRIRRSSLHTEVQDRVRRALEETQESFLTRGSGSCPTLVSTSEEWSTGFTISVSTMEDASGYSIIRTRRSPLMDAIDNLPPQNPNMNYTWQEQTLAPARNELTKIWCPTCLEWTDKLDTVDMKDYYELKHELCGTILSRVARTAEPGAVEEKEPEKILDRKVRIE